MRVENEPVAPEVTSLEVKAKPRRVPPQLMAWVILLLSFSLFCFLVYTVVSLVTDYLSQSVQSQTATVQPGRDRDANVLVLHKGQPKETLVSREEQVKEGAEIRTDKTSEAVINLFDGSRVNLAPGSRVRLEDSRVEIKNFRRSEKRLVVYVLDGFVTFTVAPFVPGKDYNKATLKALLPSQGTVPPVEVLFNDPLTGNYVEGTYTVSVSRSPEDGVRAWLNNKARKPVDVRGVGRTVSVGPGQRLPLEQGVPGEPGLPGERQLEFITNGSFINGVDSWGLLKEQGSDRGVLDGIYQFDAERIGDGVQPRGRIWRLDPQAEGNYAETSIVQELNRDVSEYDELWFSIKVKLISQSLPGGGQQGFEYPLFVKIQYLDKAGNQQEFFYGFYYKAADNRTQVLDQVGLSKKLVQDEWEEYRRNLLDLRVKPARILKIIVGSAGHLYDSYFTDVSIVAR